MTSFRFDEKYLSQIPALRVLRRVKLPERTNV
jgi:hypothetical protein